MIIFYIMLYHDLLRMHFDCIVVEHARVRLPAQPGEEGSDYINASFLQVRLSINTPSLLFVLTKS